MARPQVTDRGTAYNMEGIANILNKKSRTAEKRWSSRLGVGRGAKTKQYVFNLLAPEFGI
jgi:hypothetical protein